MNNKKYLVIGSEGLVGKAIINHLEKRRNKVIKVNRNNYNKLKGQKVDVLINANGNSYRYKANNSPKWDFDKSFLSVKKTFNDFKFNTYVYISSVDAYHELNDTKLNKETCDININDLDYYGFHKYLSEQIVRRYCKNYLIFRLGSVIGPKMKKGPIYDIMNKNRVNMNINSKLTFIQDKTIALVILKVLNKNINCEIFNLTGKKFFSLNKLLNKFPDIKYINSKTYSYDINVNKINKYHKMPSSEREVYDFLKAQQ